MEDILRHLFESFSGKTPESCKEMNSSGSNRRYFRLCAGDVSAVGVIGTSREENEAFCTIGKHFLSKGIPVPKVLAVSQDGMAYIQEDLGDASVYQAVAGGRENGDYSSSDKALLCKVMECLPAIQFRGAEGLDWSKCYPEPAFGPRTILFDLNYFKYCFLKATGLEFNEVRLQEDFEKLKEDLLCDIGQTFMYRDFQARNVMLKDGAPYFIDFQGGRRGPIHYDVASFIWQARARYPEALKQEMLSAYIKALRVYIPDLDEEEFKEKLRLFVLFRCLQTLGAYGFRGYFERKPHFLASVPYAIDNLRQILSKPFGNYPYLNEVLSGLVNLPQFPSGSEDIKGDRSLEVCIYSFSYKKGIPADDSGNGGGYVFDCRAVHNPGKYEFYRQFNGMDKEVIKFLEDDGEVLTFLDNIYGLVDAHVKRFIERGFTHLQVCFGCTGGQHRSVYCAEHLAAHLAGKFGVRVRLIHRELNIEKEL